MWHRGAVGIGRRWWIWRRPVSESAEKECEIALGRMRADLMERTKPSQEFGYYVNYGMTPLQAIRSGTVVPAGVAGLERQNAASSSRAKWADLGGP